MNILNFTFTGSYTSKMSAMKWVLFGISLIVIIPSIYTNKLFLEMFFDTGSSTATNSALYMVSIFIDACKFVALVTFANIYFASLSEERRYVDGISLVAYALLVFASIFFQYEGLQHDVFAKQEQQIEKDSTLKKVEIVTDTSYLAAKNLKAKSQNVAAQASLINALNEANKQVSTEKIQKSSRMKELKSNLLDKRFFFILFCEFLAVFCCLSICYLDYREIEEEKDVESEGNDTVKKLQNAYRTAYKRGSMQLAEKHKKELESLGAKIPKIK